jgi:hypothetical protein
MGNTCGEAALQVVTVVGQTRKQVLGQARVSEGDAVNRCAELCIGCEVV